MSPEGHWVHLRQDKRYLVAKVFRLPETAAACLCRCRPPAGLAAAPLPPPSAAAGSAAAGLAGLGHPAVAPSPCCCFPFPLAVSAGCGGSGLRLGGRCPLPFVFALEFSCRGVLSSPFRSKLALDSPCLDSMPSLSTCPVVLTHLILCVHLNLRDEQVRKAFTKA